MTDAAAAGRPRVYTPDELLSCVFDPGWADHDAGDCVVVRLDGAGGLDGATSEAVLQGRLAGVPVPLIGLGAAPGASLAKSMDVLAGSEDDLELLVAPIRHHPTASAVLVQVLRSTSSLTVEEGLVLESLAYGMLQSGREFADWLAAYRARPTARSRSPDGTAPPPADVVLLERLGERLEIVLDSPRNRNALSTAMRDGLTEAFRLVAMDETIRQVDVRGNGPCFSAGGDLTEFGTTQDPSAAHMIRMLRMPARYLAAQARRYHFHLHGACVGAGIELPAFAGRITAAPDTFFQLPEVAMGLIPGAGGCVSIPRRIGRQRTAYLALTGQRIGAAQAHAWGLVDAVEA